MHVERLLQRASAGYQFHDLKRMEKCQCDAGSAADTGEISPHSDLAPVPGWLNAALLGIYRIETPLTVRLRMPFGSSLLVLARRRQ